MTGGVCLDVLLQARAALSPKDCPPTGRARKFFKDCTMKRLAALFMGLVLGLAGLVLFGQGAYIHAKALLAQLLLDRAFAETLAPGHAVKPWSWADTWPVARIDVKRLNASAIVLAGS